MTEPCPRCAGQGHVMVCILWPGSRYSIWRDRCLGCGGTGAVPREKAQELEAQKIQLAAEMAAEIKRIGRLVAYDVRMSRDGRLPAAVEFVIAATAF